MIGGVVKEEKVKQVKAVNIKEVWKTRTETLAKRTTLTIRTSHIIWSR